MNNPFKLDPLGFAPLQGNGHLPTGEYYYIRSRASTSIEISETEQDWWDNKYLFGCRNSDMQYVDRDQLIAWATLKIKLFYKNRKK